MLYLVFVRTEGRRLQYLNRHADAGRCGLILSDPARTGKTTCLAQLGKTIETMHHPHAAAPVATWAAWPSHAAALRQARHLSSSVDTLVSLGILAACGWSSTRCSCWTAASARLSGLANLLYDSGGGIYLEVAASVTTFLLARRLYEAHARRRAGQAMRDLAAASAKDVCVLSEGGPEAGREQWVPASGCGRASGSWSAPGSGSPPTARCWPTSRRWTAA